jgi:hypothetical protein
VGRLEGGDEDQAAYVRGHHVGVGGDRAAAGVPGDHDRRVDGGQDAVQVAGVGGEAAHRHGRGEDTVAAPVEVGVTPCQTEASVRAPWTSTIVGACPDMGGPPFGA